MPIQARSASDALVAAGVELITTVPDSLLSPILDGAAGRADLRVVQVNDEATAVDVAAGATLAGTQALVVMENSGLRRACETLSRLVLAHRLHVAMLISHRGSFGEDNWWGIAHSETMHAHQRMLRLATTEVRAVDDLEAAVRDALGMLRTGQCSVCVVAERPFLRELRETA